MQEPNSNGVGRSHLPQKAYGLGMGQRRLCTTSQLSRVPEYGWQWNTTRLYFVSKSEYGSPNDHSCLNYRRSGLECSSTPNLVQDGAAAPEPRCSFAPASTATAAGFACIKQPTMGP
ncbi:hypothetical protein CSAL01_06390 [Colletotrichum salicis]|uniref:Uncharacterized protein n=1 Tax=Colletotrichum salicis TaxID=1209931 RepID=A0A135UH31_9PEZI|nr:hypothetical protein CSAL01_06390 [Colletotrichum salicis]